MAVDVLFADGELREYSSRRVVSVNTHGTGCTLSSAVASFLALGLPLAEAVGCAKTICTARSSPVPVSLWAVDTVR